MPVPYHTVRGSCVHSLGNNGPVARFGNSVPKLFSEDFSRGLPTLRRLFHVPKANDKVVANNVIKSRGGPEWPAMSVWASGCLVNA